MSQLRFDVKQGLGLVGSILRLDAVHRHDLTFVSSAAVPGVARAGRAICSELTRGLMRVNSPKFQALVAPYMRPFALGELELTMIPAGYIPGAAQLLVQGAGQPFLYVSHLSLKGGELAPGPVFVEAPTLVIRVGDASHPNREQALSEVVDRAKAVLNVGKSPVFMAPPVGKAQQVIKALFDNGIPVAAHRSIYKVSKEFRQLGFDPGPVSQVGEIKAGANAIVWPLNLRRSPTIARAAKDLELILLFENAADPYAVSGHSIRYSTLLSSSEVLEFVGITKPKTVYTVGPGASSVAALLGKQGISAHALVDKEQLNLFS